MTQTINCRDCGRPVEARNPHTRYCAFHRLYRNLLFLKARKHTCMLCDERFAPVARDDAFCAGCDRQPRKHYVTGSCAFCNQPDQTLWSEDVRVCVACIKDPEQRKTLLKALLKKAGTDQLAVSV